MENKSNADKRKASAATAIGASVVLPNDRNHGATTPVPLAGVGLASASALGGGRPPASGEFALDQGAPKTLLRASATAKEELGFGGAAFQSLPNQGEDGHRRSPDKLTRVAPKSPLGGEHQARSQHIVGGAPVSKVAMKFDAGRRDSLARSSAPSHDTGMALSRFSAGHQTPRGAGGAGRPAKDDLSLDEEPHLSVGEGDPLVKFGVDMTELSDYLDNIIQVVNQHAKLLDKVSDELEVRPKATVVGELFAVLGKAYPYERALN